MGAGARSALPLPPHRRSLVRRRRARGPSGWRSSSATSPRTPASGSAIRSRSTTAAGEAEFRIVGIAENQQEDGTALYVPLTTARELLDQPTLPGVLDQDGLFRAGVRGPHHQPPRGSPGGPRLRDHQRGHLHRRAGRGGGQPITHHLDRRARLRDRGHEHGRARQRHHHERARAHPRDRHPPQHRRPPATSDGSSPPRASLWRSPGGCSASRSATCSRACWCGSSGRSSTFACRSSSHPGTSSSRSSRRSPWRSSCSYSQ